VENQKFRAQKSYAFDVDCRPTNNAVYKPSSCWHGRKNKKRLKPNSVTGPYCLKFLKSGKRTQSKTVWMTYKTSFN